MPAGKSKALRSNPTTTKKKKKKAKKNVELEYTHNLVPRKGVTVRKEDLGQEAGQKSTMQVSFFPFFKSKSIHQLLHR
jgi:hypothetical protein